MNIKVHVSSFEVFIPKVHIVFLFGKFVHFSEFIHIELSYEGGEMFMPKIMG